MTTFQPGDLISFIFNAGGKGTCLAYGPVVSAIPGQITVKAPTGCVTADPDGMLRMSDHPDFVERKPLNDACALCGVAVHTVTFRPDQPTSYDATGSHRCADGEQHLGRYWSPPCQTYSHAGARR